MLSERVRSAYDTDRTSLLESFLSGGTFTDLLAEMSYFIDVGEQDKALADQIALDQATLASLHQETEDTRTRTNELRQETAAQKRALDASLVALKDAKAELKQAREADGRDARGPEADLPAAGQEQGRGRGDHPRGCRQAEAAGQDDRQADREAGPPRQHPERVQRDDALAEDSFSISGDYGCSSFEYYAPGNGCAHYHNGIDLVGPERRQGPRGRAPAPSSTSGGTGPTAPTRPGS